MPNEFQAILWNDDIRIEGKLILEPDGLIFYYKKPKTSGLNLVIPKAKINSVEEYLLFGVERKGLRIKSGGDRIDKFIVDNPRKVRRRLTGWLNG
jgi:hypothetical protein